MALISTERAKDALIHFTESSNQMPSTLRRLAVIRC
jgi:hypothetical protein